MNAKRALLAGVLLPLLLAGCSTPQVALDQAQNGAALVQQLEAELSRYAKLSALAAQRRLKSIESQEAANLESAGTLEMSDFLDERAQRAQEAAANAALIRSLTAKQAELKRQQLDKRRELAERLAAATKSAEPLGAKLGALRKAMAELGSELKPEERLALTKKFLDDAKKIIDDSAKAAGGAASAPDAGS